MNDLFYAILGFSTSMAEDTARAWRRLLHELNPVEPLVIENYLWNYDL